MADPYADIDPPRGPWVWLALGIYVVSFFVPFGAEGERILSGYHAFGYSLAMLVYGPLFGFTGDRVGWWLMIAIAGLRRRIARIRNPRPAVLGWWPPVPGVRGVARELRHSAHRPGPHVTAARTAVCLPPPLTVG